MERNERLPGSPFSMFYRFTNRPGERRIAVRPAGLMRLGVSVIALIALGALCVFLGALCSSTKQPLVLYVMPGVFFFFMLLLLFELLYMFKPRFDFKRGYYVANGFPALTPEQFARIGAVRFEDIGGVIVYRSPNGRCTLDFLLKDGRRKPFQFGGEALVRSNAGVVCEVLEIPLQDDLES